MSIMKKNFEKKLRSLLKSRYDHVINLLELFPNFGSISKDYCFFKFYKPIFSVFDSERSLHIYVDPYRGVSGNFLRWLCDDLSDLSEYCHLVNISCNGGYMDLYFQIKS